MRFDEHANMRRRVCGAVAVAVIGLILPASAHAQTFTVDTTGDSGAGSLRAAIDDSNATAGPNTIDFALPGGGVQTIQPTGQHPAGGTSGLNRRLAG